MQTAIYYDDWLSLPKYGWWEKSVSGGTITRTEADSLRDAFLYDAHLPTVTKSWNTSAQSEPMLQISCKGYFSKFAYPYNHEVIVGDPGVYTASEKVIDVLDADPNNLFSSTNAMIEINAQDHLHLEDADRTAEDVLREICSAGDGYNRWLFQVFNDRMTFFISATRVEENRMSEIAYMQQLRDPAQRITTGSGATVHPMNVLPAKWLMFTDFLAGKDVLDPYYEFRNDPRMMFIETVTFTAPDQLDLQGGKLESVPQILADYELEGSI